MGLIVWFSPGSRESRVESSQSVESSRVESSESSLFAIDVTQNDRILHRTAVLRSDRYFAGQGPDRKAGFVVRPRWHNFIPSIEEHPFVSSTASTRTRGELRSFARRNFLMGVFQLAGCAKPHQSGVFHGVSFRPVRWMEKPLLCGFLTWLYWVFFNSIRWSVGLLFRTFCVVVPYNSRKIPI